MAAPRPPTRRRPAAPEDRRVPQHRPTDRRGVPLRRRRHQQRVGVPPARRRAARRQHLGPRRGYQRARGVEYAVEALDIPLVVVLGHDDCPAMRVALRAWEQAQLPDGAMRAAVEHALLSVVRRGAAADSVESVTSAHIVETGLGLMQRSPALARRVDRRECGIVCATLADRPPDSGARHPGVVDETNGDLVDVSERLEGPTAGRPRR